MDNSFFDVDHKPDPKKVCIHEENHFNGKLHAKVLIVDKNKKEFKPFVWKWLCIILSLLVLALLAVLAGAIYLNFFTKRPAMYQEDCKGRSCVANLGLKCINNKCKCETNQFYTKKCNDKRTFDGPCHNVSQCVDGKRLVCLNGKCVCVKNSYWNGDGCQLKKHFGQKCGYGQCLNDLMLECNANGTCSCNSTRFWDGFVCAKKRTINEKCISNESCLDAQFLKCINKTCSCDSKIMYFDYNVSKCVNYLTYGEGNCFSGKCAPNTSLICNTNSSRACTCPYDSYAGMCDCFRVLGNESYWNFTQGKCVPVKLEGVTCEYDYECLNNMSCISGTCKCPFTYFYNYTTFTCQSKTLNNTQCMVNTTCRDDLGLSCQLNRCQCDATRQFWLSTTNECRNYYDYANVTCTSNDQCRPGTSLVCNLIHSTNKCNCPSTSINGMCDCVRLNGTLNESYWDLVSLKCTRALEEYHPCEHTYQCYSDMICNSTINRCMCPENHYFSMTTFKCLPKTLNNTSCNTTVSCRSDLGLACAGGLCTCDTSSQFWRDNSSGCINYLKYTEATCLSTSECNATLGLICNLNVAINPCNCPLYSSAGMCDCLRERTSPWREFYWNSSGCSQAKNESESCLYTYECRNNLTCDTTLKICTCPIYHYYDYANRVCVLQTLNNTLCTSDRTCRIDLGLTCQSGTCQCASTHYWTNSAIGCKNLLNYGDLGCSSNSDCKPSGNMFCNLNVSASVCNCPTISSYGMCDCMRSSGVIETYWDNTRCSPAKIYNVPCSLNHECLDILYCNSTLGTCQCNSDLSYFHSPNNTCLPKTLNNTQCSNSLTCRTDLGLACKSNVCQCNDTSKKWYNSRIGCSSYLSYSNTFCNDTSFCTPGTGLICNLNANTCNCPTLSINGMCDCPRHFGNYTYWNLNACVRAHNESVSCTATYECLQNMICNMTTRTCQCPFTFYYNYTTFTCVPKTLNGSTCSTNNTCRSDLGLYCKSGMCACNSLTQFWYNNSIGCRNYLTHGETTCQADWQCKSGVGLFCNLSPTNNSCNCPATSVNGMCDCVRVYNWNCESKVVNESYWDLTTMSCKPSIEKGKGCIADYQCMRPFNCVNSKCEFAKIQSNCLLGWFHFMGKCYKHLDNLMFNQYETNCRNEFPSKNSSSVHVTNMAILQWLSAWNVKTYIGGYTCCAKSNLPSSFTSITSFYPMVDGGCVDDHDVNDHDHGGFCVYTP